MGIYMRKCSRTIRHIDTRLPKGIVHIAVALYIQWAYILSIVNWLVQIFTKRKAITHLVFSILLTGGIGGYRFYMFQELPWTQLGIFFGVYWVALLILFLLRNKLSRWSNKTWETSCALKGPGNGLRGYIVINTKYISKTTPEMEAEICAAKPCLYDMDLY